MQANGFTRLRTCPKVVPSGWQPAYDVVVSQQGWRRHSRTGSRPPSHPVWLAVAASLLGACAVSGPGVPGQNSSVPRTNSSPTTTNPFRGYRLEVPAGWSAHPTTQAWTPGHRPDPYVPGFDTLERDTTPIGLIAIGRRQVAADTTPKTWMASLRREGSLTYGECGAMGKATVAKLGDESAVEVLFPCPAHQVNAKLILAVHARTGWAVLCAADDTSTMSLTAVCDTVLGSFRYA